MKKLFRTFLAVAAFAAVTGVSSCTKVCDTGYEGDKCDVKIRDKFIGQWQGQETCTVGTDSYTLTIGASGTDILKVTLNNIYNQAFTATATVDGTTFTVANQNVGGTVTVQGNGTVSGNNISFQYTISDGTTSNTCTFTGTKL
jgi:hypothetical protein